MLWATIRIEVIENPDEDELTDSNLEDIDIAEAVIALEDSLPELPKGAGWDVKY